MELQGIGESGAQLKGISFAVKFPLLSGFSIPAHKPEAYKSAYKYLAQKEHNEIGLCLNLHEHMNIHTYLPYIHGSVFDR